MLACRSVNRPKHVVRWRSRSFPWLRNHLPHMPAHSRQSERQNIIARTHTWQQCSVNTSEAILTTKYGINNELDNNTNILAGDKRAAHAPIGPHSHQVGTLLKWNAQHSVAWNQRGRTNTIQKLLVPTSPQLQWDLPLAHKKVTLEMFPIKIRQVNSTIPE